MYIHNLFVFWQVEVKETQLETKSIWIFQIINRKLDVHANVSSIKSSMGFLKLISCVKIKKGEVSINLSQQVEMHFNNL